MTRLDVACSRTGTDVTLRFPPNWTTVLFLAALGTLHLLNATHAFVHGRWEGFLSMIFATVFLTVAFVCRLITSDIAVLPGERQVRLRTGVGRLGFQRF